MNLQQPYQVMSPPVPPLRRRVRKIYLLLLVIAHVYYINSFRERRQIVAALRDMKTALEEKNTGRLAGYIADDYSDSFGLNHDALLDGIANLQQQASIAITIKDIDVSLGHRPAKVQVEGTVIYQAGDYRSEAIAEDLRLLMRRTDKRWQVITIFPDKKYPLKY